ncbi:Reverse transcriptase zinc-binding domain [Macleaya cordata]|uniref:Reverse transcriptase zinc-binding domain n=1 Tax=Macleaya cordata TaxID=56857 RepID=A0A200QV07_MACCD|nr:Reverse transcriptase zinc-binding domain [Macleaya cordata]
MRKYCIWEVGKGNQIEIWNDTWLPDLSKPVALNNQVSTITHQKVEALISPVSGNWNQSVLNEYFDQPTIDSINSIRIPLNGSDQIKWNLSKDGEFSVKSYSNQHSQSVHSSPIVDKSWAIIWKQKLIPKIQLFIWKCLSDSLPTNAKINSIITTVSSICPHCLSKKESLNHLILECPYSIAVWRASNYDLARNNSQNLSVHDWIKSWFFDISHWPTHFPNIILVSATISWFIWKSRCSKMFQGNCPTPLQTAQEAILLIQNQQRVFSSHFNPTITDRNRITYWRPPSSQALKFNIDASFVSPKVFAGIGILIRDNAGSFKAANCIQLRATSSEHAEGLAILAAVKWAQELNLKRLKYWEMERSKAHHHMEVAFTWIDFEWADLSEKF